MLTGEVGTGKTTLLHRLMSTLEEDPTVTVAFSYYSTLTFEELLSFVCADFGLTIKDEGHHQAVRTFTEFLIARSQAGGTTALMIDEAQDLEEDVLENLFLLANPQSANKNLLQIILVGQQPELEEKLSLPRLRQLQDSIALRRRLTHLKTEEVYTFIRHRLRLVGCKHQGLFTPEAIHLIALYSKGIPRVINLLCDQALRATYEASRKTVSAEVIQRVAHHLQLEKSEVVHQENYERETSLKSKADLLPYTLTEEPTQLTLEQAVRRGNESWVKASSSGKAWILGRTRRPLVWSGGVVLAVGGFLLLTSRTVEQKMASAPLKPQVLGAFDPQSEEQPLARADNQLVTLAKRTEATPPSPSLSLPVSQPALRGKTILENLIAKYQEGRPLVWGLATANPALALLVPQAEWDSLSKEDQVSLTLYLESLIPAVRAHPEQYIQEFRTAPVYETFLAKVANLCLDCWVIGGSHLTVDAKHVLFDKVIVQGDSLWEKAPPHNRGEKASVFRAELKASQENP
jgi:type II secretory pathway predicted ATPase ExeA